MKFFKKEGEIMSEETSEEKARKGARKLLNENKGEIIVERAKDFRTKTELKCHRCGGTFPRDEITKIIMPGGWTMQRCNICQKEHPYKPRKKKPAPEKNNNYEIQTTDPVKTDTAKKILEATGISDIKIDIAIEALREKGIVEKSPLNKANDLYKEIAVVLKNNESAMKLVNAMRDNFIDYIDG